MYQCRASRFPHFFVPAAIFAMMALALTGCGMAGSGSAISPVATAINNPASKGLAGNVHGGQQPIVGGTVKLWAAGVTGASPAGYGANATLIATTPSDSGGGFNFDTAGVSPCIPGQYLYITATGGDSGSGNNIDIALMAAIPTPCGPNTGNQFVMVNEVTTVAAVAALQQFMSITPGSTTLPWQIGAPASNVTGLTNAFLQVGNLVDTAGGASNPKTVTNVIGGVTYTTTITPDANKIDTFANVIASCVNTAGPGYTGSASCADLFTDATPTGSSKPTDTLQVAYYMAKTGGVGQATSNATANPSQLSAPYLCVTYASSTPPFPATACNTAKNTSTVAAGQATYPTDWAIAVAWTATNGTAAVGTVSATGLALDASGNVWTSAAAGIPGSVVEFNQAGQVIMAPVTSHTYVGGWEESVYCATSTNPGCSSSTPLGGNHTPQALAVDTTGAAWVTAYSETLRTVVGNPDTFGNQACAGGVYEGTIAKITNTAGIGTADGYLVGYQPAALAIDSSNNIFLASDITNGPANSKNVTTGSLPNICADGYYVTELAAAGTPAYSSFSAINIPGTTNNDSAATNSYLAYPKGSPAVTTATYGYTIAIDQTPDQNVYLFGATGLEYIPYYNHNGGGGIVGSTTAPPGNPAIAPQAVFSAGTADALGNLWTDTAGTNSGIFYYVDLVDGTTASPIYSTVNEGSAGATVGGAFGPRGLAIDGSGHLWVVNSFNGEGTASFGGGLSELLPGGTGSVAGVGKKTLTGLSPAASYTAGFANNVSWQQPWQPVLDSSGNVWVSSLGGNVLNYVVGMASPVVTPIAKMIANTAIGVRP